MDELEEVLSPDEAPYELQDTNVPPEERPTLRKLLDEGVWVYGEILERLAPYISFREAAEAQRATHRSISALGWSALGLVALAVLVKMPAAQDLLTAASLLTALVLVSRFRIPFAGRLLVVGSALMTSFFIRDAAFAVGSSLGVFLGALLLGALVDYGASTELDRRRPRLRRMALLLAGLLFVLQAWNMSKGLRPSLTLVAALITCAWAWWPAPLLEAWVRLRAADADILWLLGMRRWAFVALGRFLAVTAVVFPFFLFLHDLEGDDLLNPKLGSPKVVKTEAEHRPVVWFWPYGGVYLKPGDLNEGAFYVAKGDVIPEIEALRSRLNPAQLYPFLGDDPAKIYAEIQKKLENRRVTSSNYAELLKQEEEGAIQLYYLTQLYADPKKPPSFVVDALAAHTSSPGPWKWLFLAYGMLGFIILWRRGGDSRLGRWIGLWFIGTGTLTLSISQSVFPMLQGILYRMSEAASESPLATFVCTAVSLLIFASMSIVFLCVCFTTCAAIWTHACWPAPREGGRGLARRLFRRCKVPLVTCCMALLFYLPWYLGDGSLPATLLGIVLFTLVTFGAGYLLQGRESIQETRIPVNRTAGFVLLLVQAIVATTVVAESGYFPEGVSESLESLTWASFLSGMVFLLFIASLIFRKNFLQLSPARDFSLLVTALVVVFAWSEERLPGYATAFTGDLASQRAREILAVVFAVGLLPPFRHWLERRVLYATKHGLRQIEQTIQRTVEELTDLWHPDSLARIDRLLEEIGLGSSVLYVRQGRNLFRAARERPEGVEGFLVHGPLRTHLAQSSGFLDLHRLADEWRTFFCQFELHRIRKATRGRFLLPICLGGSLRALLIVPEAKQEAEQEALEPVGEPLAEDIAQIGLIAAQLRGSGNTSRQVA